MPGMELPAPTPGPEALNDRAAASVSSKIRPEKLITQLLRFGLVGCFNTMIDLLVLNALLWLWPTQNTWALLLDNSLAYSFGALNSFILNKYWTFRCHTRTNPGEVARFLVTTLAGLLCNDVLLWLLSGVLQQTSLSPTLGTNVAKVLAIGGTVLISYLGMRLWVFVQFPRKPVLAPVFLSRKQEEEAGSAPAMKHHARWLHAVGLEPLLTTHSLSVVLPVYNEEQVILTTVEQVLDYLARNVGDFEVIVVNDGSTDRTAALLSDLARREPRLRVLTHERNQGYGAALADGFAAATKELTFFMDSDGQFDIRELQHFLPLIDAYDAVIGYRLKRQDTLMRRLNAWGWKLIVGLALHVHARDIDCAFKLLRTDFLQRFPLETRGAMINAELLYRLKRSGCRVKEVGVRHLPRQGGRATGAKLRVIGRAFWELFLYRSRWRREEAKARALSERPCSEEGGTTMGVQKAQVVHTSPGNDQGRGVLSLWHKLALGAIVLTSIFLNFYHLGQSGFGNLFYAAGVRSMVDSLHNFFFVSYDPGGFVTVDKPPLGFWLQAISVKLFGFTPFSIFLPQALAGVLAVLVLFYLVRRHFGVVAGLLAALALAITPLSVVTARNNTIDSTLVLVLLLGAWAIMLAAETGRWRWLLLSATLIGLGFNIKMLEAYLVLPAFGLLYLLAAPRPFWLRSVQLLVALLVLLTVSLSWAIAVDLTPASQRPYVGSSPDNSEISLAFGYNGIDRLLGRFGLNRAASGEGAPFVSVEGGRASDLESLPFAGTSGGGDRQGRGAGFGSGAPGPLRLFTEQLGGQISWLLPIALLGLLALAWQARPNVRGDRRQQSLLLWGMWLLTMGVFFSISQFFHQYYMTTFAPAICALFGIGLVVMWQDYRRGGWRGWLLPLALVATAAQQIFFIASNPAWGSWLIPLIALPCALAALLLCVARLRARLEIAPRALLPALSLAVAALLLTPAVWSALPAWQNMAISTPSAGPTRRTGFGDFRGALNTNNPALISYLEAHQGQAKFLLAVPSSMSANSIILATNKPVMALGGFAGADPILTPSQLASLVAAGTVRFFLLSNPSRLFQFPNQMGASGARSSPGAAQSAFPGFFGLGLNSQSALTGWVTQHCRTVPAQEWQGAQARGQGRAQSVNAAQLYDCANGQ
jgi:4-amino-4-deoxy-L-arabinose transferase-like glycosyltransferase/putative flippase GtrA